MATLLSEMRSDELVGTLVAPFPTLEVSFDDGKGLSGQRRHDLRLSRCDARIAFSGKSADIETRVKSLFGHHVPTYVVLTPDELLATEDAAEQAERLCHGLGIFPLQCRSADICGITINGLSGIHPGHDASIARNLKARNRDVGESSKSDFGLLSSRRPRKTIEAKFRAEVEWLKHARSDLPQITICNSHVTPQTVPLLDFRERLMAIGRNINESHLPTIDDLLANRHTTTWINIQPDRIELTPGMTTSNETNYLEWQYREARRRKERAVVLSLADAFFSTDPKDGRSVFTSVPLAAYSQIASRCHRFLRLVGVRHAICTFPMDVLMGRDKICIAVLIERVSIENARRIGSRIRTLIGQRTYPCAVMVDLIRLDSVESGAECVTTLSPDGLRLAAEVAMLNSSVRMRRWSDIRRGEVAIVD